MHQPNIISPGLKEVYTLQKECRKIQFDSKMILMGVPAEAWQYGMEKLWEKGEAWVDFWNGVDIVEYLYYSGWHRGTDPWGFVSFFVDFQGERLGDGGG